MVPLHTLIFGAHSVVIVVLNATIEVVELLVQV